MSEPAFDTLDDTACVQRLEDACAATLLFHSGGPWDRKKRIRWKELVGVDEASTRTLCDFIRSLLTPEEPEMPRTAAGEEQCARCGYIAVILYGSKWQCSQCGRVNNRKADSR